MSIEESNPSDKPSPEIIKLSLEFKTTVCLHGRPGMWLAGLLVGLGITPKDE